MHIEGFEWDPIKATTNLAKHGVSFEEATTVFVDPWSIAIYDPDHSDTEDRYATIGRSIRNRILVVVNVDRGQSVRLISARESTARERQKYEKGKDSSDE